MTDDRLDAPSTLLEPDEIGLLVRGLLEWGGPAHANDDLARAMGFAGAEDFERRRGSLRSALQDDSPITSADWARILLATEIVFASDLMGSGTEWRTTTGMTDEETITLLRAVQRKLGKVLRGRYFTTPPAATDRADGAATSSPAEGSHGAQPLVRAGLTLLGEAGTAEDVRSVWRMHASASAEPSVRISDELGEVSGAVLDQAWMVVARQTGVISDDGEFLLSVSGVGAFDRPWLHVRADGIPSVRELGPNPGEPEFVASSLDRSVTVAVSTEEYEVWILVRSDDQP